MEKCKTSENSLLECLRDKKCYRSSFLLTPNQYNKLLQLKKRYNCTVTDVIEVALENLYCDVFQMGKICGKCYGGYPL